MTNVLTLSALLQLTCLSALVIGIEIGLFNLIVKNGGSVKKAEDMAKIQRIDPPLLCKHRK